MLNFDMAGRLIAPSRLRKTIGGDIDGRNGIPAGLEIPTTGDYAHIAVSDYGDPLMAKTLTWSAAGRGLIRGPVVTLKSEMVAFCVRVRAFGGGSSATSGSTRRDFGYGLQSDDGLHGLFKEYRSPDRTTSGNYITARAGGVDVRHPILYQDNNPAERYAPEFWVSRNPAGGWTATLCEGDRPRVAMDIPASEVSLTTFRPLVFWDWTYPTGACAAQIAYFSLDIFWRF